MPILSLLPSFGPRHLVFLIQHLTSHMRPFFILSIVCDLCSQWSNDSLCPSRHSAGNKYRGHRPRDRPPQHVGRERAGFDVHGRFVECHLHPQLLVDLQMPVDTLQTPFWSLRRPNTQLTRLTTLTDSLYLFLFLVYLCLCLCLPLMLTGERVVLLERLGGGVCMVWIHRNRIGHFQYHWILGYISALFFGGY